MKAAQITGILLLSTLPGLVSLSFAQEEYVNGRVTDAVSNDPLEGAGIKGMPVKRSKGIRSVSGRNSNDFVEQMKVLINLKSV